MISLSWNSSYAPNSYDANQHIGSMMAAFRQLPRHMARKHIKAAMRRTLAPGVKILRKHTPPLGTRRGRRKAGEKKRSTGDLRRRVTVKTGQTGRNPDFDAFIWGVLGYKIKGQDRKHIWLNYGTSAGIRPYDMIGRAMAEFGPVSAAKLAQELRVALEKAAAELASGKNPGMSARGRAAGL
jgi:hypothetical protein